MSYAELTARCADRTKCKPKLSASITKSVASVSLHEPLIEWAHKEAFRLDMSFSAFVSMALFWMAETQRSAEAMLLPWPPPSATAVEKERPKPCKASDGFTRQIRRRARQ